MGKLSLGEISVITMGQSPSSETYNFKEIGLPFFQGKTDFGNVSPSVRVYCSQPQKTAKDNDILISVRAPVGATNIADRKCCIGRGLAAITSITNISFYKYIFYCLKYYEKDIENMGVGSTFKAISRKDLETIQIPLPPLHLQQKIADVLDRANALIEKRKAQIEKLDLLVKSQFVEMFGDPVTNPMGWEVKRLGDLGSFKNGINFNAQDKGYTIKCLGVGDFGNLYKIDDMDKIKEVSLSNKLSSDYLLQNGDILFVRSNGNIELVGRCIEIIPHGTNLTFSGFCIRYRIENKNLLTVFINHMLHLSSMKAVLLKDGRGANIQNVNQQMLSSLNIPVPPLSLQNQFAAFIERVEAQKSQMKKGLELMELEYKSMIHKCLNGEIY